MRVFHKSRQMGDSLIARGNLQLRLHGFTQQTWISLDAVLAALDAVPSFHLLGLQEICFLSTLEMHDMLPDLQPTFTNKRQGAFIQAQRRIVLSTMHDQATFYHVLYHELGHYVYFLVLSSQVKQYWVTQVYPHSVCLTAYGQVSAAEDFAETYAMYLRDPQRLKLIPEKYAFMENLVFSGARLTLKERSAPE